MPTTTTLRPSQPAPTAPASTPPPSTTSPATTSTTSATDRPASTARRSTSLLAVAAVQDSAIFDIDTGTAREIENAARHIAATHQGSTGPNGIDDEALLLKAAVAIHQAAPELLGALLTFRVASSHDGVLLLRGMPTDDVLPDTPADGVFRGDWRDLAVSTIGQLMVMSALGDVIAYADEKHGRLLQDVIPIPGAERRQENSGSCLLELHTEDGFHPHKPDFLSLFGLRADHERQALTLAGGIRPILALLDPRHVHALRQPDFRIRLASSFVGDRVVFADPIPVFSGPLDDPEICVDFHAMEAMTPHADEALQALRELMISSLVGKVLEPGDLLVIDNRKAVHGRTAFTPHYTADDRWLRRCFAVSSIRESQAQLRPGSRVHAPLELDLA